MVKKTTNKNKQTLKPVLVTERLTGFVGSRESVILHTVFFVGMFVLVLFGFPFDRILLILTTIVSLEAIYLSIFIQMTVNRQAQNLEVVGKGLEEIQEDVEEIQEDVEEIQEDVEEIQEDVEEIQRDVDEIQEDVQELEEGVDEITQDDANEKKADMDQSILIARLEAKVTDLLKELEKHK